MNEREAATPGQPACRNCRHPRSDHDGRTLYDGRLVQGGGADGCSFLETPHHTCPCGQWLDPTGQPAESPDDEQIMTMALMALGIENPGWAARKTLTLFRTYGVTLTRPTPGQPADAVAALERLERVRLGLHARHAPHGITFDEFRDGPCSYESCTELRGVHATLTRLAAPVEQGERVLVEAVEAFLAAEYPNGTAHPADAAADRLRVAALAAREQGGAGE